MKSWRKEPRWRLARRTLNHAQPPQPPQPPTPTPPHPGMMQSASQARGSGSKFIAPLLRGPEGRSQAASLPREESRGPQPSRAHEKRPFGICSCGVSGRVVSTAGQP